MITSTTDHAGYKVDIDQHMKELQRLVNRTEDDLRERSVEIEEKLRGEWQAARDAERTLDTYETWRDEYLTQVAVGWVLTSVFLRYLEDNALIAEIWLAGPGQRLQQARDHRRHYFQQNPTHTDREYLQQAFRSVAVLPGCEELFGEKRNPLWLLGPSGDLAKEMVQFWQEIEPETGELKRIFGSCGRQDEMEQSGIADTRFLGDLYQDLSEAARKRYALLQTPDFVEEFILDYTLEPAVDTFGLDDVRMLDPTCGSGHFLLGGFARLLDKRHKAKPGEGERERVQKALNAVYGVDLNPFAVAIARFRLLVAALNASGIRRLKDAPNYHINVACGDSLLHGRQFGKGDQGLLSTDRDWMPDAFAEGDFEEATRILSQQYHAVVGNPPYIVDRDKSHNQLVRELYQSCYKQFHLSVPFVERFFELSRVSTHPGYVGIIKDDAFMTRDFGRPLVEQFLPTVDLNLVVDLSAVTVPGHGTPTVVLFGRSREPVTENVEAVMTIKGEYPPPLAPQEGKVWQAVLALLSTRSDNDFVSLESVPRSTLAKHPWNLKGAGVSALFNYSRTLPIQTVGASAEQIGRTTVMGEDQIWLFDSGTAVNSYLEPSLVPLVIGDRIRNWCLSTPPNVLYPYKGLGGEAVPESHPAVTFFLWRFRTSLKARRIFGKTLEQKGEAWFEHLEHYRNKLTEPLSIAFAFLSNQNHFVLDNGGKLFKQSAPVIKLSRDASVEDHINLTGFLNSSFSCFFLKATGYVTNLSGVKQEEPHDDCYQFSANQVKNIPYPPMIGKTADLCSRLHSLYQELSKLLADESYLLDIGEDVFTYEVQRIRTRQIAYQEELDWRVYAELGLVGEQALASRIEDIPSLQVGERAFEFLMAGHLENVDRQTNWYRRQNGHPVTTIPESWPESYRSVVEYRMSAINSLTRLRTVERPTFKRMWTLIDIESTYRSACVKRLLARIESLFETELRAELQTTARLGERLQRDTKFVELADLYYKSSEWELSRLVDELTSSECIPFLSAFRYTESGLRKRAQWEKTWDLQRKEDAGEKVGKIPVPPKYGSGDFQKSHYWRLRGKLDVPKERFISYPLAERTTDPSPVIGWAGWNHLDQAKALATYYLQRKEQDGWTTDQLTPLLTGLQELIPWLKQWHNDIDPDLDQRLGDFYEGFLDQELRHHNLTPKHLKDWRPPSKTKKK